MKTFLNMPTSTLSIFLVSLLKRQFMMLGIVACGVASGVATANDSALKLSETGNAHFELKNFQEAVNAYEQALKKDLAANGKKHITVIRDYKDLGNAWLALQNYNKAIEYYENALNGAVSIYGASSPVVKTLRKNIVDCWQSLNQYKSSILVLEDILDEDLRKFGRNHPEVVQRPRVETGKID